MSPLLSEYWWHCSRDLTLLSRFLCGLLWKSYEDGKSVQASSYKNSTEIVKRRVNGIYVFILSCTKSMSFNHVTIFQALVWKDMF